MRFHKITCQGGLFMQRLVSNPSYLSRDEGRALYNQTLDQLILGCDRTDIEDFVAILDAAHDVLPEAGSQYKVGSVALPYLEMHSDEFIGPLTGDVTGNLDGDHTGDVYASSGSDKILENGTDGTDAEFTGDIMANNGATVLSNGGTPSASTYLGTATKAKYA